MLADSSAFSVRMPDVPLAIPMRALGNPDACQLAERNHRSIHGRHQHFTRNLLRVGTHFTWIAHGDTEAFAAFDRGRRQFGAECRRNHILHLADGQDISGKLRAVGFDVEVEATGDPFGEGRGGAGYGLDHRFDLLGELFHLIKVLAEHLDADRCADAGGQHVDTGLDRHGPGIGDAGELQRLVHFRDQLVHGHAATPFRFRSEIDHRFEHLGRCRVRRGVGATSLAVYRSGFREGLDDLVLRLHQFGGLGYQAFASAAELSACAGEDDEPLAEDQQFQMAGLDACAAVDDRIDVIVTLAEIAARKNLAAAEADQKRRRSVFEAETCAEGVVQVCHNSVLPDIVV